MGHRKEGARVWIGRCTSFASRDISAAMVALYAPQSKARGRIERANMSAKRRLAMTAVTAKKAFQVIDLKGLLNLVALHGFEPRTCGL